MQDEPRDPFHCAFCLRHQTEVRKLIMGHEAGICDECVATCVEILATDLPPDDPAGDPSA